MIGQLARRNGKVLLLGAIDWFWTIGLRNGVGGGIIGDVDDSKVINNENIELLCLFIHPYLHQMQLYVFLLLHYQHIVGRNQQVVIVV